MTVRVGINGFGRIGRDYLRCALNRGITVAAINDVADPAALVHLLRHDSTYGRFDREVSWDGDGELHVDGQSIALTRHADPADIDWGRYGVDLVIESTGRFRSREDAAVHLKTGPRTVLISAPGKGADVTIVLGVNHADYDPRLHQVVSAGSCTTNCVTPMVVVLDEAFGIKAGLMTTVHAYTGDQRVHDAPHKDLRRARAAAVNIIPTTTGAAQATALALPELKGKLNGVAMRVPVPDGSVTDLTATLDQEVTVEQVNEAFRKAAEGELRNVLVYTEDPIVSTDIVGSPASCTFDAGMTKVLGGNTVKIIGWYDNEWGYSNRVVDLTTLVGSKL
jgi:glyceraldehyde 3-phosphate dehydrogenase